MQLLSWLLMTWSTSVSHVSEVQLKNHSSVSSSEFLVISSRKVPDLLLLSLKRSLSKWIVNANQLCSVCTIAPKCGREENPELDPLEL